MLRKIGIWLRWCRDFFVFAFDLSTGRRAKAEKETAANRHRDCSQFLDFSKPLRVLDVGSGRLTPQLSILGNQGHFVVGIDIAYGVKRFLVDTLYKLARFLFSQKASIQNTTSKDSAIVCADVGKLPFNENTFDLITSVAAFEHFLEVEKVIKELHRVLRPGGISWISIHNFCCLSGGHNIGRQLASIRSMPLGVAPWDHLRQRKVAFTVPLNRLRPNQYIELFSKYFEILSHKLESEEGNELLTSSIREELHEYSEDELTLRSITIVCRKSLASSALF